MNTHLIRTALLMQFSLLVFPLVYADESPDAVALRAIRESYEQAVNGNKTDPLRTYFGPETTAVMVTGDEVASYEEFSRYFMNIKKMIGEGGSYTVKTSVDKTDIFGDFAIARGTTQDKVVTDENRTFEFASRWTAVCRKSEGNWKLVRLHASMDPLDNSFIKAAHARVGFNSAIVGIVLGLVMGILTTWFFLRRRR